jgi:hypothetical protein
MTVIINELEHVSPPDSRAESRRDADAPGSRRDDARDSHEAKLLSLMRREASRQARLWAD